MFFMFVDFKDLWFCVGTGKLWEPLHPSSSDNFRPARAKSLRDPITTNKSWAWWHTPVILWENQPGEIVSPQTLHFRGSFLLFFLFFLLHSQVNRQSSALGKCSWEMQGPWDPMVSAWHSGLLRVALQGQAAHGTQWHPSVQCMLPPWLRVCGEQAGHLKTAMPFPFFLPPSCIPHPVPCMWHASLCFTSLCPAS
jgi:hypothetical protein